MRLGGGGRASKSLLNPKRCICCCFRGYSFRGILRRSIYRNSLLFPVLRRDRPGRNIFTAPICMGLFLRITRAHGGSKNFNPPGVHCPPNANLWLPQKTRSVWTKKNRAPREDAVGL